MKEFLLLVKAVYSNAFNGVRHKKGKTTVRRNSLVPLVISGLVFTFVFAGLPLISLSQMGSIGVPSQDIFSYSRLYLSAFVVYGFFMACCNNIPLFFSGKDEAFLPLPIKGGRLFLARFVLSLFYCAVYSFLPMLLLTALGCYFSSQPPVSLFFSVVLSIFLVIGIDALAFVFVDILFLVFRIRKKKTASTVLAVVFSLLSVSVLLALRFVDPILDNEQITADGIHQAILTMEGYFSFLQWTTWLPGQALDYTGVFSVLCFFLSLLLCLAGLGLAILVGNLSYRSLLVSKGRKRRKKEDGIHWKKTEKSFTQAYRHPFIFLIRREIGNFRQNPNIIVSSVVSSVSIIVSMAIVIPIVLTSGTDFPQNIAFLLVFSLVMTSMFQPYFTYASISLEGRSFLLLKTYPFDKRLFLLSKLFLGTLFSFLVSFIMMLVFSIVQGFGVPETLFSLLALLGYSLFSNLLSLLFGIHFATFSFDNSVEILQRGWGPRLVSFALFFTPLPFIGIVALTSFLLPDYLFVGPLLAFVIVFGLSYLVFRISLKEFDVLLKKDISL